MIQRAQAEEHLRVIRSLMEKATIYRAISAEAAAVGGALAIFASFAFGSWLPLGARPEPSAPMSAAAFFGLWFGILAITAIANFCFLRRDAIRRGNRLYRAACASPSPPCCPVTSSRRS